MFQVLRRPLVTEKGTQLREQGQYLFEVDPSANKIQIKQAIEARFDVKVTSVRTVRVKGKRKIQYTKRGMIEGRKPLRKKAYVTVAEGHTIDIFDTGATE